MMPVRFQKADLAFCQTDMEAGHGHEIVADFVDPLRSDDGSVTRPLRMWIDPVTAMQVSMIARAHDVPSTVILGAIVRNGVRSWPGSFEQIEQEEHEPDPAQLVIQFDNKEQG